MPFRMNLARVFEFWICGPDARGSPPWRMATVKIAFVGCGNIASKHLESAMKVENCLISVVVDPCEANALKLASEIEAKMGAKPVVFTSLASALASDPDGELFSCCDVMVPNWEDAALGDLHEAIGTEALCAKRHVLLEKPIAASSAAGRRVLAAHARCCPEKVFMVAENSQYWPEVVEARALIGAGAIGEILSARARFWESAMGEWAGDYAPGSWRCDASKLPAAGFTFDGSTHWVRPLRLWMGDVDKVVGLVGRTLDHMPGASMSQHVLKFASGKAAVLESMLGPSAISDQPFFQIQGTKGEIVIDGFEGGARLYTAGADGETLEREVCREGWDAGYDGQYEAFVAAVRDADDGRRPGSLVAESAASALRDLMVVEAMFAAAEAETRGIGGWATVGAPSASVDGPPAADSDDDAEANCPKYF